MNFPFASGPYSYRPLRLADPMIRGWDAYGLQTALNAAGADPRLAEDGYLGKATAAEIKDYQVIAGLVADGIAGVVTQRSLALRIAKPLSTAHGLPAGLMRGQIEHESSYWLGNYSAEYPNHSRDCGVVQRNTQYTVALDAFNVPKSLEQLAVNTAGYHKKYRDLGVAEIRAWGLAAGAWNAPAWTTTLAKGGTLRPEQRAQIEAYIADCLVYVVF